jgi:ADP-ribosylglycohydrolase
MVVECCYLYCFAIRLLIVDNLSRYETYEQVIVESNRRARLSGYSTIKYWIENDIESDDLEEMPKPSYSPINYIKISILWAFYYLKNDYEFDAAIRDIVKRGGETSANAAIVGGLIGAYSGAQIFNKQ